MLKQFSLTEVASTGRRRRGKQEIPISSNIAPVLRTSRKSLNREQAFTLVELLAVLLTIGLLGTLTLPTLAKSNGNGRRTICTNNLRQMGTASTMYANDNGDYLAYPNWG